jgi:GNAT superfamily N-acetyltransferase
LPPGHVFPEADPDRWYARLDDPAVTMLVADEQGDLVGFTACGAGEVMTFFVAAGHWRRGVGRALMDAALSDLAARGYAEAVVWSFADNERANAFYEASGFSRDGAERTEESWANITEIRFRRALP